MILYRFDVIDDVYRDALLAYHINKIDTNMTWLLHTFSSECHISKTKKSVIPGSEWERQKVR